MIKLAFSFLFLFSFFSLNSQNIDSIYLAKLSEKSSFYGKQKKYDSALLYSNKLLNDSKLINDSLFELKAYNKLAKYNRQNNSLFQAARFYFKSQELNLKFGDTSRAIDKLRFIASIQKTLGDFNSSENTAIEALLLSKTLSDSLSNKHQLAVYNHLGITSNRQKNYLDAINWYQKALTLTKDTLLILGIKNNIALASIKLGNYNKAIYDLTDLLRTSTLKKNINLKARIIDNLAYAKSKLNLSDAEAELQLALECRKDIMDSSGQFASNIHLTEHYQDRDEYKKALFYANQAYQLANTMKSATSKIEALSYLIKIKNNPKTEAVEFERLTDSLYTVREKAKNQFAKIKYETDQYREENLKVKAKNAQQQVILQKQKTKNIIYSAIGIFTILASIFLFFYLKTKHRKEKIVERHTTEKRLSKKLHDELGNDVFYLMSQLQNEPNLSLHSKHNAIINGLDAVYHKVRDFSRDHKIETGPEYGDELLSLLNSYGNQYTRVFTNRLDPNFWATVSDYKKVELYWVIKELLTNMKKHSKATLVSINILKEKKNIMVKYTDNGIGTDLSITQKRKNGLYNVENRIQDINGTITFETKPKEGFKSIIKFAP